MSHKLLSHLVVMSMVLALCLALAACATSTPSPTAEPTAVPTVAPSMMPPTVVPTAVPTSAILPPTARVNGLALSDLAAVYNQDYFKIPLSQNPLINLPAPGSPCNFATIGNIGLLLSSPNSGSFDCTMPSTLMLYVPVIADECSTVESGIWYGGTPEELRACALKFSVKNPKASVDGIAIGNIADYSAQSAVYNFTLPEDNIFKTTTLTGQSVANNLAFILNPLSPGKHTIYVYGETPAIPNTFEFTYNITVKPGS